jgi:hypothetical protein
VTGELVATDVESLRAEWISVRNSRLHWAPCWVSWYPSWVLYFTVEGDSSCALVLPPHILPSMSMGISGLESSSNMRGSWGGR